MKKLFFLTLFSIVLNSSAISQLDSVSVNAYYTYLNQGDSLNVKTIRTETWVNDFDFFGEIVITVYENETNYPIHRVKHNKEFIDANDLYSNGLIKIDLFHGLEEGRSYRVDVLVRNYQGMHYPIISKLID